MCVYIYNKKQCIIFLSFSFSSSSPLHTYLVQHDKNLLMFTNVFVTNCTIAFHTVCTYAEITSVEVKYFPVFYT